LKKNVQKSFESDENCLTSESCSLLSESVDPAALIVFAIRGPRNGSVIDSIVSFTGKHEKIHIFDLSKDHITEAFHIIVKRIQQLNLKQKLKGRIRICICGSGENFSQLIGIYFSELNKKSIEWANYFSFILLSTDFGQSKSDLAHRYGVLCPRYRSTFIDNEWFKLDVIFNNFELILSSAIHTVPVPVGEALVSFLGGDQSEGKAQKFIPFCVEVIISEDDNYDSDSDCDERHGSKTLSPTSSPFNHHSSGSIQASNIGSGEKNQKLQLSIDYWIEEKDNKQNTKETLHYIKFIPQKQNIRMDMNIKPKRGGMSRLPGRHKLSGDGAKSKNETIVRAICKSRNAIEKSKITKIAIDGVEYHNISYFQISKLTASGHTKTFPIALFTPNIS